MSATQSSCMTLYGLVGSDYGTVQYQIWNCLCDQEWSELVRPKTVVILMVHSSISYMKIDKDQVDCFQCKYARGTKSHKV